MYIIAFNSVAVGNLVVFGVNVRKKKNTIKEPMPVT